MLGAMPARILRIRRLRQLLRRGLQALPIRQRVHRRLQRRSFVHILPRFRPRPVFQYRWRRLAANPQGLQGACPGGGGWGGGRVYGLYLVGRRVRCGRRHFLPRVLSCRRCVQYQCRCGRPEANERQFKLDRQHLRGPRRRGWVRQRGTGGRQRGRGRPR